MKHINIALFVPHMGCPNQCSFCNQKSISGQAKQINADDVKSAVNTALEGRDCAQAEIAFFGGSFTAIDRDYMISLLEAASEFIRVGQVKGIRVSTRPDCIDEEVLGILKSYGVTAIELGCQSMDDGVLRANLRGHDAQAVVRASGLIKSKGFELGLQMMTGLYMSDSTKDIETAEKIIELSPDTVRIYPTVVLEGTMLCDKYTAGEYRVQTLEEGVELCSKLLLMFHNADIPVIRLGLHSGGNVEEGFVAGVYHPAFRELCESRIYLDKIKEKLVGIPYGEIEITVGTKFISQLTGQKKTNLKHLEEMGYRCSVVQNPAFKKYELTIIPKG
ncbi:MAG: radical SAM protein [Clostridia bacterium]|nr:radical SAM protein [Clostridia bacterium]